MVRKGFEKCFLLGIKSGGWVWRWAIGGFLGCVLWWVNGVGFWRG